MVLCRACDRQVPLRSFLFSPVLAIADVVCPYCRTLLRAGSDSRRVIRAGLLCGGLAAFAAAGGAHLGLGWSSTASLALIPLVAVIVGAILTAYSWVRDDYHLL